MTDVASLDLCKELYELSGWEDTDSLYYQNRHYKSKKNDFTLYHTGEIYATGCYTLSMIEEMFGISASHLHHLMKHDQRTPLSSKAELRAAISNIFNKEVK